MNDDETVGSLWNAFKAPVPYSEPEPVLEIAERNLEEPKKPPEATEAEFSETAEEPSIEIPTESVPDNAPGEVSKPQEGTIGAPATGALGASTTGALGALDDLYYRRVWQWSNKWDIVAEGPIRSFGPNCVFEGPTFCKIPPPPYIYEIWWRYVPHTFGVGGSWDFAGERQNW